MLFLLWKVADLIKGETVALIAVGGGNNKDVMGAVDCSIAESTVVGGSGDKGKLATAAERGLETGGGRHHGDRRKKSGLGNTNPYERARADARNGSEKAARNLFRKAERGSKQVFVENLFVLPEHRRMGVGRELVKGVEAFARSKGAKRIFMEVARSNTSAINLYRSCGYEAGGGVGGEDTIGGMLMKMLGMGNIYMSKYV